MNQRGKHRGAHADSKTRDKDVLIWLTGPGPKSSYVDELVAMRDIAGVDVDASQSQVGWMGNGEG